MTEPYEVYGKSKRSAVLTKKISVMPAGHSVKYINIAQKRLVQ